MLSHPLNGSVENRMTAILEMVSSYKIDGVILFAHWGCRHSNGSARIIKDTLRNNNVSTLILDGDCLNKNNSSEGQILTRIQGFMEIINSKQS
jgi:benzoyl-CoA reductase/2-hydroxyglutaryl-CoA dehydratase subunit BcrC/BadD/HgdB